MRHTGQPDQAFDVVLGQRRQVAEQDRGRGHPAKDRNHQPGVSPKDGANQAEQGGKARSLGRHGQKAL